MRKIVMIRDFDDVVYENKKHDELMSVYELNTFSKSPTISNLVDLISDIDLLIELGYQEYLNNRAEKLQFCEDVIQDTMHMRNLFIIDETDTRFLNHQEKVAYVSRADLKSEIQFISTNETFMKNLMKILTKINDFNNKKNERIYTPKKLVHLERITTERENNELREGIEDGEI